MIDGNSLRCELSLSRQAFKLNVDVEILQHGITGLFGLSGCGKTTLLRCIAGLEKAAAGRLGTATTTWQDTAAGIFVAPHRRGIGFVFQEARLFPHLDVEANLGYGQRRLGRHSDPASTRQIVASLGIDELLNRRTSQLSGGEQQRIAIARALLTDPSLLLLDEPLSGLDQKSRDDILGVLQQLQLRLNIPVVYVSHNVDEITQLSDRLIVMRGGRVAQAGGLETLLGDPDVFGDQECGVLIQATIGPYDPVATMTTLHYEGGTLYVPGPLVGRYARVRILARDVSITRIEPVETSILNCVRCNIDAIHDDQGSYAQVHLISGEARLIARISGYSRQKLQLTVGDQVIAQIKGVAVKTIATTALKPAQARPGLQA